MQNESQFSLLHFTIKCEESISTVRMSALCPWKLNSIVMFKDGVKVYTFLYNIDILQVNWAFVIKIKIVLFQRESNRPETEMNSMTK